MTYPISSVHTTDGIVNVLQLSDLHLHLDIEAEVAGHNCHQSFIDCLTQALSEDIRCDLILITGDLVNEVKTEIYDRIFEVLEATDIPFACISGNHDVTDEIGCHLPFFQRQLVPHPPDARLLSRYCITANDWQILLIDSSVPGKVSGEISQQSLDWIQHTLEQTSAPSLIALHHHVTSIESKWLDRHIAADDNFWQILSRYPHAKAVISGHIHQEYMKDYQGVALYSTPSTCFQFKPNNDDFALDFESAPGYRWLQLGADGSIRSWVSRLTQSDQTSHLNQA